MLDSEFTFSCIFLNWIPQQRLQTQRTVIIIVYSIDFVVLTLVWHKHYVLTNKVNLFQWKHAKYLFWITTLLGVAVNRVTFIYIHPLTEWIHIVTVNQIISFIIQSVPGGKDNILAGDSRSKSKNEYYINIGPEILWHEL